MDSYKMRIEPFKKEHMDVLVVQERQRGLEYLETDETFRALEGEASFTALDGEDVICCAGLIPLNVNRAFVWAYLSQDAGKHMFSLTKAVRRYMRIANYPRIEMHVDCNFDEAHRWAKMLGFEKECERMKHFTPDKRDCALYALVKP